MLFFNANFICYYFYPTKKREEPLYLLLMRKSAHLNTNLEVLRIWALFTLPANCDEMDYSAARAYFSMPRILPLIQA